MGGMGRGRWVGGWLIGWLQPTELPDVGEYIHTLPHHKTNTTDIHFIHSFIHSFFLTPHTPPPPPPPPLPPTDPPHFTHSSTTTTDRAS